jgi:hypothetical protein
MPKYGPGDAVFHHGYAYAVIEFRELDNAYLAQAIGSRDEYLLPADEVTTAL